MSWFNQALELCGDDATRAYFRAVYWSRSHRGQASRAKAADDAERLRGELNPEQLRQAQEALALWKRRRR